MSSAIPPTTVERPDWPTWMDQEKLVELWDAFQAHGKGDEVPSGLDMGWQEKFDAYLDEFQRQVDLGRKRGEIPPAP